MLDSSIAPLGGASITDMKISHDPGQHSLGRRHDQMKMIAHEYAGTQLVSVALGG